jgi:hypothetical protein
MKKQSNYLYQLLLLIFGASLLLLSACGDNTSEEPALYTPAQIQRLLTEDSIKVWQQLTEYYLEDSCRTGHHVLFSENGNNQLAQPFLAYFFRDAGCEPIADSLLTRLVFTPKLPQFATTDSLAFVQVVGEDSIYSYSTIKLLTSQRLLLESRAADGSLQQAEYRALMEE